MTFPNQVSSTTTDVGTPFGQINVGNSNGFTPGATVLISSQVFPTPYQLKILSIQGNQLNLVTLQDTIPDLSQFGTLPTDTTTITQITTPIGWYTLLDGNPGSSYYGYFNKVTGPDTGNANEWDQFWCLNASNNGDSIIWICSSPGVCAPQWAAGQSIQINMQRSNAGNNYVATSSGTTSGGNAPTGTATETGTDGITWIYVNSLPVATFNSILLASPGGSPPTFVNNEIPTGSIDGINGTFTLLHIPLDGINVYLSGLRVPPVNYTLIGNVFTFVLGQIPPEGSYLYVDYSY